MTRILKDIACSSRIGVLCRRFVVALSYLPSKVIGVAKGRKIQVVLHVPMYGLLIGAISANDPNRW